MRQRKVHECEFCAYKTDHSRNFTLHVNSQHKNIKATCPICTKKISEDFLTRHIETVHEGKRLYECKICKKSYTQKTHLNTHIEATHKMSKHKCGQCKYETTHKYAMKTSGLTGTLQRLQTYLQPLI